MMWTRLLETVLCPGLLTALLLGLAARGVTAWLGARAWQRPALPVWSPFAQVAHLAGKGLPDPSSVPPWAAWPGLVAVVALSWAAGMLPWPQAAWRTPAPAAMPVLYLALLAVPALARLAAAGFSGQPLAALGVRRQVAVEIARLLPVMVAGGTLPLLAEAPRDIYTNLVRGATALLLLATLPWPVWDHGERDAPLAALGGRALLVMRAVEALELTAYVGLVAMALPPVGILSFLGSWAAPLVAWGAALVVLMVWEGQGRRNILPEMAQWYTRLALPIAVLVAVAGWFVR